MRFGIVHFTHGRIDEVIRLGKLAEEENFDSYWISEVGLTRDLYMVIIQLASQTKRIQLGAETNIYTRHPAITANAISTMDEISSGRAALILGSGHRGYILQAGIQVHPNATAAMEEAIQICRGVWSGKPFSYDGVRFKIRNLRIGYETRKEIPIIIAENDSSMIELAGTYADGVFINFTPLAHLPRIWEHIKSGLAKSSGRPPDFRLYIQPLVAIAKDRNEARKAVEKTIFHSLSLVYSHDALRESIGLTKDDLDPAFQASMKEMVKAEGDLDFATLRCAPVILKTLTKEVVDRLLDETTIYGTVEDVIERLKKYEKAGVWEVPIGPAPYPNPYKTEISHYIKIIGDEIIPHFR